LACWIDKLYFDKKRSIGDIMITKEITHNRINLDDIVSTLFFVLLVTLVCVALIVSIRKLSKEQKKKAQNSRNVEQKLDKIIDLLEGKKIDN